MSYFNIKRVDAHQILDSRGNWTLRVFVITQGRIKAFGDAPAGMSKSIKESVEIRDENGTVENAIQIVKNYVEPLLIGIDVRNQRLIDELLINADGTENKRRLGGNVTISTSIAVLKAAAYSLELEPFEYIGGISKNSIPIPLLNIINGGLHAGTKLKIQEFLIIPISFENLYSALKASVNVYKKLKELIKSKYGAIYTAVGDEGGFVPPINETEEALKLLEEAIREAGYKDEFKIGIDAAASNFYVREKRKYELDQKLFEASELLEFYINLVERHPIIYIEDPFQEDDISNFAELQKRLKNVIIVGDDLYSTNIKYLINGIKFNATKGTIVKPNQIGTITETIEFCNLAKENSIKIIISHRSGDTEDNFIADLATGISADFIKTGAPARSERLSKYNRLLEIEKNFNFVYRGKKSLW
jgi:enolase